MLSRSVPVLLVWLVSAVVAPPPSNSLPAAIDHAIQQVTVAELREHISVLASDKFAGRGLGHEGNREAETYIAGVLREGKVLPAIANYLQRVDVYSPRLGPRASLTISDGDKPIVELRVGSDFLPQPESSDRAATGPLLFVQHGVSAPAQGHDDYANIDATGAVVLALDGVPDALLRSSQASTDDKANFATLDRKVDDARTHGAVGLIVIRSYVGDAEVVWPSHPSVRSAAYRLYGPMHDNPLAV